MTPWGHVGCNRLEADVQVAYAEGHLSQQPGNLRAHVRWFKVCRQLPQVHETQAKGARQSTGNAAWERHGAPVTGLP